MNIKKHLKSLRNFLSKILNRSSNHPEFYITSKETNKIEEKRTYLVFGHDSNGRGQIMEVLADNSSTAISEARLRGLKANHAVPIHL